MATGGKSLLPDPPPRGPCVISRRSADGRGYPRCRTARSVAVALLQFSWSVRVRQTAGPDSFFASHAALRDASHVPRVAASRSPRRRRARAARCPCGAATARDDRDAFGGLFRTLDAGANWSPVNPGIFASGALALAVSPRDENHLLLATDSGAWRSRNAGRDWTIEAPDVLTGPAVATAFDLDGERALMAGAETLFRFDGDRWRPVSHSLRRGTRARPRRCVDAGPRVPCRQGRTLPQRRLGTLLDEHRRRAPRGARRSGRRR